jgi:hypothetical protein
MGKTEVNQKLQKETKITSEPKIGNRNKEVLSEPASAKLTTWSCSES